MCDFETHMLVHSFTFHICNEPLLSAYLAGSLQGFNVVKDVKVLGRFLLSLQDKVLFPIIWVLGAPQLSNILALLVIAGKSSTSSIRLSTLRWQDKKAVIINIQMARCLV